MQVPKYSKHDFANVKDPLQMCIKTYKILFLE